jgi:hypothetical protein
MVSENIDLQTRILGSGLRIDVLANIGDLRGAAAAEQKKEKLQAQQNMLGEDVSFLNLILSDDNVLRDYLSNSEAYGEQEAILRLSEHVERLRTTPGYNQCNFLTNPYIKL